MNKTSTRFSVVVLGLILGLIEGILRTFLKEFPVIEIVGFQGTIIGAYLAARTASGIKNMIQETERKKFILPQ